MLKRITIVLVILIIFVYLNNSSYLTEERATNPLLLAHRGVAQTFSMEGIEGNTCTAQHIYEPEHPYLENTIPSMEAAFEAGADVVELDIRPTKDGQFAVFHDWALDCRTDVKGEPKLYTMAELKQVDIGYGYTADEGKTFPFRGRGIGLMPSLDEVLKHFPDKEFLVHIKSDVADEGLQLAEYIATLPDSQQQQLTIYGGDAPIQALKTKIPEIPVMSKATLKSCLLPYVAIGWTGYVPKACKNTQIHIPENIAPWLWGWPNKMLNRMDSVDTRVIIVAGNGKWSEGFDTEQDLKRLPEGYTGGIWTNRIDVIAPIINGY